jgi:hypothetical protein
MLLATDIPTPAERAAARAAIPWGDGVIKLAGLVRASFDNRAIDLIEGAIGPPHARAGLVSLYESLDVLLQAAIDLAEMVTARSVLARINLHDPLGGPDSRMTDPSKARLRLRASRFGVEDAAVKIASAGDHLVNAHLRIAWEANAATEEEMRQCGFDPTVEDPDFWSSCELLRRGLKEIARRPLSTFGSFVLTPVFRRYLATHGVMQARRFRNQVVHRERPSYDEVRSFGRATRWESGHWQFNHPAPPLPPQPTIDDRFKLVCDAGAATLLYARESWDVAKRWMGTVGVSITDNVDEVTVRADIGIPRPRELRDPGPFLVAN